MLLDELRKVSKNYNTKAEIKRQKSIKKYEVKVIKGLRRAAATTGKISFAITLPKNILKDITDIFEDKGFKVAFLGWREEFTKAQILIEDEER